MHPSHSRDRRAGGGTPGLPTRPPGGMSVRPGRRLPTEPDWAEMSMPQLRAWLDERGATVTGDRRVRADLVTAAKDWWDSQ